MHTTSWELDEASLLVAEAGNAASLCYSMLVTDHHNALTLMLTHKSVNVKMCSVEEFTYSWIFGPCQVNDSYHKLVKY